MKILLTNDDGYDANGIKALYSRLLSIGEVLVVAPMSEQSSTGHGITHSSPLKIKRFSCKDNYSGLAVDGKPADCVKVALGAEWPSIYGNNSLPDLVVSGINIGANVGIHTFYSGTVAAAREAAFMGCPAIALSLFIDNEETLNWKHISNLAIKLINALLKSGIQPGELLNVNIPASAGINETFPEIHFVSMSKSPLRNKYEKRTSPYGKEYFWSAGGGMDFFKKRKKEDVSLVQEGNIVITPLSFDLTNYERMKWWEQASQGNFCINNQE